MGYNIDRNAGIVNRGNWYRIKKCMQKALERNDISVGFIGGSITNGSLSSKPTTCYSYLVYEWWKSHFPFSHVTYINAGIGGTSSQFGVARVQDDLLSKKPDFCIAEFSVNDDNNEHFQETYEGLIRRIYGNVRKPALLLVHNVFYDGRGSAEEVHLEIGKRYDLPCVSMKSSILPKIEDKTIPNREITPDDLHPNDAGHALVASVITNMLDQILESVKEPEKEAEFDGSNMPTPLTKNQYEHGIRLRNCNYEAEMAGFTPDHEHSLENFQNGWIAWNLHDKISFKVKGMGIAVQYRKSIHRPTSIARVIVDGDLEHVHILDGNFDEDWGDCLYLETVTERMKNIEHTVEIEIVETHEKDQVPFYLLSVIGSY